MNCLHPSLSPSEIIFAKIPSQHASVLLSSIRETLKEDLAKSYQRPLAAGITNTVLLLHCPNCLVMTPYERYQSYQSYRFSH